MNEVNERAIACEIKKNDEIYGEKQQKQPKNALAVARFR